MKLKKEHGAIEIKGLGIKLTQASTEEEIKAALKAAPHLAAYIEGAKASKSNG